MKMEGKMNTGEGERCNQKNMKMGEEEEVMMLGQLLGLCTSRKKT